MFEKIRRIIASAKPSPSDAAAYYALTAPLIDATPGIGRSLWYDTIIVVLGEYYAGINRMGTMASILGPVLGIPTTELTRDRSVERHNFVTYWADAPTNTVLGDRVVPGLPSAIAYGRNLPLWSAGEGACSPGNTNQTCPTPILRLDYGFRPDYWSNSHHFFAFFWLGYLYGFRTQALTGPHEAASDIAKGMPINGVDIKIGEFGARLGFVFSLGVQTPEQLIARLEEEMCLSPSEIAALQQQINVTGGSNGPQ